MRIKVVIHKAEEGGYWAEVPALRGCYSQGETLPEVKANIREAIELYLDTSYESVEPVKEGDEILELDW